MGEKSNVTGEMFQTSEVYPGRPGVRKTERGYQFTAVIPETEDVSLLLYKKGEEIPVIQIDSDRAVRVGDLLSFCVKGITADAYEYNYKIGKDIIQDPYANAVTGDEVFGKPAEGLHSIRCGFKKETYRWQEAEFVPKSLADSILYKLQVRNYTMHPRSGVRRKGTFKGLEQKIPYIKELGVTGVLLMPAYDYREMEKKKAENSTHGLKCSTARLNCWGYTGDACYFAPKTAFSGTGQPVKEFKEMVNAFHKAGLECLMEFYFDGSVSPSMMLDILHHWKKEYHVDGFHLLGYGICQELFARDALLSRTKLLFHEVSGEVLYQGKTPLFKNVAEYQDGFLYCMRHLLKSDENMIEEFIYRNKRNPKEFGIINYLADQDGFTMMDMVSYDEKHNEENGEENRDGLDYNCSWNCGAEGATRKQNVRELRLQQLKNAFLLLLLSQGTPMLYQGDEFGNSQMGNNNAWCQDNPTGWVDWTACRKNKELLEFVKEAVELRKNHAILHMPEELKGVDYRSLGCPDLSYHGTQAWYAPCERNLRHMGMMYCGDYETHEKEMLFVAYNLHWMPHEFALPRLHKDSIWKECLSSSREPSAEWIEEKEEKKEEKRKSGRKEKRGMKVPPRTVMILIGKQEKK